MANPKGNPQNLTPNSERTPEERRKNAQKAGKASAKKSKERKEFKEALKLALTVVMDNNKTVQEIGIEALMEKFMKGDPKVFEIVRDSIGEKPTDKQEVKVVESDWFK